MRIRELLTVLAIAGGAAAFGWLIRKDRSEQARRQRAEVSDWENEGGSLERGHQTAGSAAYTAQGL